MPKCKCENKNNNIQGNTTTLEASHPTTASPDILTQQEHKKAI